MQPEIYRVMYRLVHKYGWNWGITRGLINRRFGTNYTADELKELYRRHFLTKGAGEFPRRTHLKDIEFTGHKNPAVYSETFWHIPDLTIYVHGHKIET